MVNNDVPALVFLPRSCRQALDQEELERFLHTFELTGEALPGGDYFLTGEKFLDCITFLGCSPDLKLTPQAADETGSASFVHVSLQHVNKDLHYREGLNPRPPLCPQCRRPIGNWRTAVHAWQQDTRQKSVACPHCREDVTLADLQWRQGAMMARSYFEIVGIYPGEAIPTEAFLDALAIHTGCAWHYLYV